LPVYSHPYEGISRLYINASKQDINFLTSNFNLLLMIKWAFYCIIIAILQNSPVFSTFLLTITQLIFTILLAFVGFKYQLLKKKMILVLRLVIEILILLFFILTIFFSFDTDNINYKTGLTHFFQWMSMIFIFAVVVIEIIILFSTLLKTKLTGQGKMTKVSTTDNIKKKNSLDNSTNMKMLPHSGLFNKPGKITAQKNYNLSEPIDIQNKKQQ